MDIIGVIITCAICEFTLNTHNLKERVLAALTGRPLPQRSPSAAVRRSLDGDGDSSTAPLHNVGAPAAL
jgi:hypothetical protein